MKTVREMFAGETVTLADEETLTGNGQSSIHGCGWATTIQAILVVDGVPASHTDETCDVKIVNYDPATGDEDDLITFTQVTDTAQTGEWKYEDSNKRLGNFIRVKWTIAGTAPDYDLQVVVHLKKQ